MMQGPEEKVTPIDTDFAKQQTAKMIKEHRQAIFRRRRLSLLFVIALTIFGFVGFNLYQDQQKVNELQAIKKEAVADQKVLADNVADLKTEVKQLQDEDYVAKLARSRFFYSEDGETIYPLPGDKQTDKTDEQVQKALENTHSSTTTEK